MNAIIAAKVVGAQLAPVTRRRDFDSASVLYQRVFGYGDRFSLNTKLMQSMIYAGGANVGAWSNEGELIGFVYGFPAVADGEPYLFSQAACVADEWRGRGVGSALKYAQMDQAQRQGLSTMRWAFDPMNLRNARLNLNRLGARARWYKPDFYDDGNSDRLIVEWDGSAPERLPALEITASSELFGHVQTLDEAHVAVTMPSTPPAPDALARLVSKSLRELLERRYAVVHCTAVSADVAAYVAERGVA